MENLSILLLFITNPIGQEANALLADIARNDDSTASYPALTSDEAAHGIIRVPTANGRDTCSPEAPKLPDSDRPTLLCAQVLLALALSERLKNSAIALRT